MHGPWRRSPRDIDFATAGYRRDDHAGADDQDNGQHHDHCDDDDHQSLCPA
jgi:hypothetical protein